ncbi:MAG: single-stranded-DNA-specific exonuclease RecJ [Campylobacterota bacterium]|nr:single-stranded-DNA-specific exonuclease RecJ [Campylobacterota bacterium]
MNSNKILNKSLLYKLLSSRFPSQDKKLSQIPNPSLLHDGEKSAKKIADAIRENKKIALVGDYDVDGVTSTAIMVDFFRQIPYPLEAIIPNRFKDGYGVSPTILDRVDADLIITVDNGISAIEAGKICKDRGIDLVITDHHTPSDILPDAYSIVDPKLENCQYPFKEICGAQVAWLLLGLLKKELDLKINMKQFLDILCIAIIADIMPLIDINRTLVIEGLKVLMNSKRPASIIIKDFLNKPRITSEDIAFQIAPRINSAGRLEDASIALDFFTATDTHTAYNQFEILNSLNEQRKETEADATAQAINEVDEDAKVIVVSGEGWHEGVVGIVASRLVDKFAKPAIVLSIEDGIAKGSARSIGDVSIYELIKENESYLTKFGGHKMAAGLGLNATDIDAFRDAINKSALKVDEKDFIPKDDVLGVLETNEIDFELLNLLEQFEPYGEANIKPTFLIKDAEVVNIQLMGKDKSHSKIKIKQKAYDNILEIVAFRTVFEMPKNKKISCSYTVSKNIYNNKLSIQLLVNKIYL